MFASSALDWPSPEAIGMLAGPAMADGEAMVLQNAEVGMAAQRRISMPKPAPESRGKYRESGTTLINLIVTN